MPRQHVWFCRCFTSLFKVVGWAKVLLMDWHGSWFCPSSSAVSLLLSWLCSHFRTLGKINRSLSRKDGRVANCSPVWKFPDLSQADCFGLSFRWQCTEMNKHLQSSRSCATWHCWRHSTSLILTLNTKGWKQLSDLMKASMSQTMTSTASRFELVSVFCRRFLANLIPWLAAGGQVCKKLGALQEDSSVCRNAFSCILVHRIWPRVFWLQDVSQLLETWNWLIQFDWVEVETCGFFGETWGFGQSGAWPRALKRMRRIGEYRNWRPIGTWSFASVGSSEESGDQFRQNLENASTGKTFGIFVFWYVFIFFYRLCWNIFHNRPCGDSAGSPWFGAGCWITALMPWGSIYYAWRMNDLTKRLIFKNPSTRQDQNIGD